MPTRGNLPIFRTEQPLERKPLHCVVLLPWHGKRLPLPQIDGLLEREQHMTAAEVVMNLRLISFGWFAVVPMTLALESGCGGTRYVGEGDSTVGGTSSKGGSTSIGSATSVGGATSGVGGAQASGGMAASVGGTTGNGGATAAGGGTTGIGGAAEVGGSTSQAGTTATGGTIAGGTTGRGGAPNEEGGTINRGGSTSLAGAAGAPPNSGPCGALEGDWTVTPTVTQSLLVYPEPYLPNGPTVGQQMNSIGLRVVGVDNQCTAELWPLWGQPKKFRLTHSAGKLTYSTPAARTEPVLDCLTNRWYVNQLTLSSLATPSFHLATDGTYVAGDTANSGTLTLEGTLSKGLPALQLTGYRNMFGDRNWCQTDAVPKVVSHLLPWEAINVESNGPTSEPFAHLGAFVVDSYAVDVTWQPPATPLDPRQLIVGRATNWDQVMGKTVRVADPSQSSLAVDYAFDSVALASAFLAEGLGQLTTFGNATLETTDGTTSLRVVGTPCSGAAYAAGRLNVAGKQRVSVLAYDNASAAWKQSLKVLVIARDGTIVEAHPLTSPATTDGVIATTEYAANLSGQTEVGVLVINQNPCVFGTASDFSIWSIIAHSPPTSTE